MGVECGETRGSAGPMRTQPQSVGHPEVESSQQSISEEIGGLQRGARLFSDDLRVIELLQEHIIL